MLSALISVLIQNMVDANSFSKAKILQSVFSFVHFRQLSLDFEAKMFSFQSRTFLDGQSPLIQAVFNLSARARPCEVKRHLISILGRPGNWPADQMLMSSKMKGLSLTASKWGKDLFWSEIVFHSHWKLASGVLIAIPHVWESFHKDLFQSEIIFFCRHKPRY